MTAIDETARERVTVAPAKARGKRRKRRRRGRLGTVGELFRYLATGGRWWLLPLVVILLLAAVVLAVFSVVEYAAPFVYTLF